MAPRKHTEKAWLGLLVAAAFGVGGVGVLQLTSSTSASTGGLRRRLSAPPNPPNNFVECGPSSPARQSERPLSPVAVASYPGSGAKMTWKLVEALTGLTTGDEHVSHWQAIGRPMQPWETSVTVKAHFPHKMGDPAMGPATAATSASVTDGKDEQQKQRVFSRAVLLLRNPADALPGHHNFVYEQENHLDNHSTRAPLDEWIRWRDANFYEEIQSYEQHATYWMEQYPRHEDRLVLNYEAMVQAEDGPETARALADFLRRSDGVDPVEGSGVDCAWARIIKYKGKEPPQGPEKTLEEAQTLAAAEPSRRRLTLQGEGVDEDNSLARSGSKYRPYTREQIVEMLAMLNRLRVRFGGGGDNDDFVAVLNFYFEQVRTLADVEE